MKSERDNLLIKAEHLTEIERWTEAIPILFKVLAQNPQHFRVICLLSLCYHSLEDYQKALEFSEKAITIAPDEEWGHRLRSVALGEQGKNNEALKSAEEAVRLAPYEPLALQNLVNAFLNAKKVRKAEKIALKMRELFPDSEASFFALGNVYLQRGNNYEAESCFREILHINPNSVDARNNLGVALLRQKQNEENSLFKSSNLSLFQKDEENEIHKHFTEAIKLEPTNKTVAENLRSEFDYFYVFYGFLVLVPFIVIAFFVAPGMTIFMIIIIIISFFNLLWKVGRNRKNLSAEMKMFIKTSSGKSALRRFNEFIQIVQRVFIKTWKPHLLVLVALFLRYFNGMPKLYTTNWNDSAAYILLIISMIWLASEIRKD